MLLSAFLLWGLVPENYVVQEFIWKMPVKGYTCNVP